MLLSNLTVLSLEQATTLPFLTQRLALEGGARHPRLERRCHCAGGHAGRGGGRTERDAADDGGGARLCDAGGDYENAEERVWGVPGTGEVVISSLADRVETPMLLLTTLLGGSPTIPARNKHEILIRRY